MRPWTREEIIFALQRWAHEYGDAPTVREITACDWLPSCATLKKYFGNVGDAMDAAGLPRRGRGCPAHMIQPTARRSNGHIIAYAETGGW